MNMKTPKYALIDGHESVLIETIDHATSNQSVCVFKNDIVERRYVTEAEWLEGANLFSLRAVESHIVTSESSAKEKLSLFRSLFRGRDDVYAHGYANKRNGGIGYAPACENEKTRRCPHWTKSNPGQKCADCPNRVFVPVNDQAFIAHFKGERSDFSDVMGLYVLTQDCKTWVLVADFDEGEWQRETVLYREECRSIGLCPAVERSRSGNGSHVWLFFDEPIDAELARNLGFTIITRAMSRAVGMSFKSYDRLFPTQSTIPEGGFGNLIALPLQGQAFRQHNSVFVNDDFEQYPDQSRYLSSVKKATLKQVQSVIESSDCGPLGQLAFEKHPAQRTKGSVDLFSSNLPDQAPATATTDFPSTLVVTKTSMLYVSKRGLSHAAQNRVRRLAAFANPEFYRAQAMHQSVYMKPRIIWCGEEDEQSIALPRGCEQKLVNLAREQGCTCSFNDKRNALKPVNAEFRGTLRERQKKAADVLLHYENGVLWAPPGFGKTVIGAYLISELKMRTIVIVPKTSLVDQWKTRLAQFLKIEDDRPPLLTKSGKSSKRKRPVIGQIGGGKNAPSGLVDVATFQSLTGKNDLGVPCAKTIVNDYELVICDECHYVGAPGPQLVLQSSNARRVYGLSATPKRSNGLEGTVFMQCGPIRHKVDPKEQAAEQRFRRILLPRFTRIRIASLEPGSSFNQVVDSLCAHSARNGLIVDDAASAVRSGRTPLVITKRKEHAAELSKLLVKAGVDTFLLTGDGTAREKRERVERVRSVADSHFAIVATGSYIGEGFDLPQLDTLMLASPYSWEGVITQYSGRLHRESEGKDDVVVYDYVDTSVPMLERMYKKRLKTYAKLGYEVTEETEARGPGARIVAAMTWYSDLASEFACASREIVISAPYASPKTVELLTPAITDAITRGVKVRFMLRKPKGEKSITLQARIVEELVGRGCQVNICDMLLAGVAVFDGKSSWYGTLPLLASPKSDDCSLRIEGAEVAADLLAALENSLRSTVPQK